MPLTYASGFQPDGSYQPNKYFMRQALELGEPCADYGDHPVGAVVTAVGSFSGAERLEALGLGATTEREFIVGRGQNEVHRSGDPTAHADIIALRQASIEVGRHTLSRCVMYTSHECCPMCAGAIANTSLAGVVYATSIEDIEGLLQDRPDTKWRSNNIRMATILGGRRESGAAMPFIIGGFMREEGLALLGKTLNSAAGLPANR